VGVLTAWMQRRGFVAPTRLLYVILAVTGAGMLYVAWKDGGRTLSPWLQLIGYDWIALFYLSILLLAIQGGLRWLRARALTFTGLISYGLYLLHYPVYVLVRGGEAPGGGLRAAVLTLFSTVVVFVLAALSWEFFEAPLVRLGHRLVYEDDVSGVRPLIVAQVEAE